MEIIIKVNSTYNNTIVSALYKGKILKTISTGSLGFKKAKRASTLAAQTCGEVLGSWLIQTPLDSLNKKINSTGNILSKESMQKKQDSIKINAQMSKNAEIQTKSNIGTKKQSKGTVFIKQVSLLISGVGYGKFGVIRGLSKLGIKIQTISEITNIPHNGCKPPKMRRK